MLKIWTVTPLDLAELLRTYCSKVALAVEVVEVVEVVEGAAAPVVEV